MAPRRTHRPLNVFMNNQFVGKLEKDPSGATSFTYDQTWLARDYALPVSLSMPLSDATYRGAVVQSVFENLLPDRDSIRRRVAERVGAEDTDAYSLLARIGRDCVGALQFAPDDESPTAGGSIHAEDVSDSDIERILANLARAPLGLNAEDQFRISVAGAQEKTALLWHDGRWKRLIGGTPTTHILKPQIRNIDASTRTIDLNNSVENEYYCLQLMSAFDLTVTNAEIADFGDKKALVIERFDRQWTKDGRLLRLPQEDCCQALSVPPGQKYQNHGGPGIAEIMRLLRDGDTPQADQFAFFKSQILFWLIGATDGHAKNFSIFLKPGGRYALTPLYDVLTAQPSFDARQVPHKYYKLAMSAGNSRHYDILGIRGRHFVETAREAGLGATLLERIINDVVTTSDKIFDKMENILHRGFDMSIHESVKTAFAQRVKLLR